VSGYETSAYGIEWMRFEPEAPVPELVRTVPHVAFEVDDLSAEIAGKEILIAPNSPSPGVTVAFIVENGAPVEFLQFDKKWCLKTVNGVVADRWRKIPITLVDQLSGLECLMRWVLLFFGSLATGVLAIVLSLALLLVSLVIYDRYILGITSNGAVGWDPVSIFGRYWVIGIPLLIFGLGCSAGFWFLSKRLHR
jgi:hypothetical protein